MISKRTLISALAIVFSLPAASQAPAPALPMDAPLVVDGNVRVDVADFEGNILRIPEDRRGGFRMSHDRVAGVIDNIYVTRSIAQKAREAGLDKDPAVQARLRQVQDAFLADLYAQKLEKDARNPDLEARARELYVADREKFMTDEEVQVQQILVGIKCRTKEAAIELAAKARAEVVGGADFLAVANRYTDEFDKLGGEKGRDLPFSPLKAFVPSVREAVTKLKKGEISEPVESQYGVHVLRVIDRKAAAPKPFDAVKDEIIAAEKARLQRARIEGAVTAIRSSPTVVTHRDNVRKLVAQGVDVEELSQQARDAHKRSGPEAEKKSRLDMPKR